MQQVHKFTPVEGASGFSAALQVRRGRGRIKTLLVGAGLTLAFLFAPTLQGINLVAGQSHSTNPVMRAADAAASSEVVRLNKGR
jgi:hypothetical protein